MVRPYKPYIPKGISEIIDCLGMMMLEPPTFVDRSGHFPERNLEFAFFELNEGLRLARDELGEERYMTLTDMSARMRAHFEADPEDRTGGSRKGRTMIEEMSDLLIQSIRDSRQVSPSPVLRPSAVRRNGPRGGAPA